MGGTKIQVEGLPGYRASTLLAASSTVANSLEGGFQVSTLVDGSLCYVEEYGNVYRWIDDSTAAPDGTTVVIPLNQQVGTPGRWILISSTTQQVSALGQNFDVTSATPAAITPAIFVTFGGVTNLTQIVATGKVGGEFVASGSGATPIAQIDYQEFDAAGASLGTGTLANSISQAPDSDGPGSEYQEAVPMGLYTQQNANAVTVTLSLLAGRQTGGQWQLRPATNGGAILVAERIR